MLVIELEVRYLLYTLRTYATVLTAEWTAPTRKRTVSETTTKANADKQSATSNKRAKRDGGSKGKRLVVGDEQHWLSVPLQHLAQSVVSERLNSNTDH